MTSLSVSVLEWNVFLYSIFSYRFELIFFVLTPFIVRGWAGGLEWKERLLILYVRAVLVCVSVYHTDKPFHNEKQILHRNCGYKNSVWQTAAQWFIHHRFSLSPITVIEWVRHQGSSLSSLWQHDNLCVFRKVFKWAFSVKGEMWKQWCGKLACEGQRDGRVATFAIPDSKATPCLCIQTQKDTLYVQWSQAI